MQSQKINAIKHILMFLTLFGLMSVIGCYKNQDYSTTPNNNSGTPGTNEIFMQGMAFTPADITIAVGTSLTWTNKDNFAHTVTSGIPGSPSGLFDSGNVGANGQFSFKFTTAGTYKYFCKIHIMMTGTITVK